MAFCSSCGTKNPEGAKFCAGCGQPLATAPVAPPRTATQPQVPPAKVETESVQYRTPVVMPPGSIGAPGLPLAGPAPAPTHVPQAAVEPAKPITAKQALRVEMPSTPPNVLSAPDPNAPGQTQFFMAAAGVSTGSKMKRVLIFVIGAIVVGAGAFFALRYAWQAKEKATAKLETKTSDQETPTTEAGDQPPTLGTGGSGAESGQPSVPAAVDGGTPDATANPADTDKTDGEVGGQPAAAKTKEPAGTRQPPKPGSRSKKPRKGT